MKSSTQLTAESLCVYLCTCDLRHNRARGVELQAGKYLHRPEPFMICPSLLDACQSTVELHGEQCCCSSPENGKNMVGGSYLRFFSRELFLHGLNRSQKEEGRFFTGFVLAFAYYQNHL